MNKVMLGATAAALVAIVGVVQAQGIERTARPVVDPTRDLERMMMVPTCAPGTPVAVSGTRFVCGKAPQLSCRVVQSTGGYLWTDGSEQVFCDADETLTGGGADAEVYGHTKICAGTSSGFIHSVMPIKAGGKSGFQSNGALANFSGEACTRAYAICCKLTY